MTAIPTQLDRPGRPIWDRLRVLVIEDHRDSRELLVQRLSYDGAHVVSAADGVDALEALRWFRPDLMLVDLGLPVMDGFRFVARARLGLSGNVPLIAVTAHDAPDDVLATLEAGFAAHLTKPVDFDVLTATAHRVLRRPPPTRPRRHG